MDIEQAGINRLEIVQDFTLDGIERYGPFFLDFVDDKVYLNYVCFEGNSLVDNRIEVIGKPKSTDDLREFIFYSVK